MSRIATGKGQKLYEEAKKIIPGGTQLLSKRPEMFLPDLWPAYYSRAKGCRIWDLDGKEYIDVSYMGIGSNVLGYANDEVDTAAKEAIDRGGMSTLNAPEEVYLAQELIKLHPWAGGVRYAKAGGEAMALASRIARAYTKKDIILFCGYHGWHDWYLSANLANKNALNDQHIAGLEPLGVPAGLAGTNLPFHYNCIEEFQALMKKHEGKIAAVVMEPIRNDYPENGFLEQIRKETKKAGIVLVFDEITAGFRLCPGGSHKILGVEPDIAVFAKGMTNGYPLSAIVGRKEVMEASQGTFISSTFYTERIAFAAALKNIELYQKYRVWEKQDEYGAMVQAGWREKAEKNGLDIEIGGIRPLGHFSIMGKEGSLIYKTFFVQEMLKRGYIASNAFYTTYAHSEEIIKEYLQHVDEVFGMLEKINSRNEKVESYLEGPICHSGFGRLN
ncbi:3-aminobutyryl-CoA aminotransferase [Lachnospiraceae bacterium]|nr:3-aminobutyryl-CoA aminotransferase [Lachnospiraceae bacterium]